VARPYRFSSGWESDKDQQSRRNRSPIRLFEIVSGENDGMTGPAVHEFEKWLTTRNIKHVYTVMPGTHSMFVWRPALANFLQEIFKK